MIDFKPMLAPLESVNERPRFLEDMPLPVIAMPKIDGIRCVPRRVYAYDFNDSFEKFRLNSWKEQCLSKTMKPLPSCQLQELFSSCIDLDTEVTAGPPNASGVYNTTESYIMSRNKPHPDLQMSVFDMCGEDWLDEPYEVRLLHATTLVNRYREETNAPIRIIEHEICETISDIERVEAQYLELGYEGLMLRTPHGRYKYNARCTYNDGIIYKLKRFDEDEYKILQLVEGSINTNEAYTDSNGVPKRSTAKDGLVPSGMLGHFIVDYKGMPLQVACGKITHKQRIDIMRNPDNYRGLYLKVRSFGFGKKNLPRSPRAIGFRSAIDMS